MAAYRRVYDSRHQQADHQEPGSAPEPYARQSTMGYLYLFYFEHLFLEEATLKQTPVRRSPGLVGDPHVSVDDWMKPCDVSAQSTNRRRVVRNEGQAQIRSRQVSDHHTA